MDSMPQMFKPSIAADKSSVDFDFGAKIKLRQVYVDGTRDVVKLFNGYDENEFIGVFGVDGIDFEVEVDNVFSTKNISYSIQLSPNYCRKYYLRRGGFAEHLSLDHNGKQLHFISNDNPLATKLIEKRAANQEIDWETAAGQCSRISVAIECQKEFAVIGERIKIKVKYSHKEHEFMAYESIDLQVGDQNTVEEVKQLIEELEGISTHIQKLYFRSRLLMDSQRLSAYNIGHKSTLYLFPKTLGGLHVTEELVSDLYGNRGVVCLTGRTVQRVAPKNSFFKVDPKVEIKPLILELRFGTVE